MNYRTILRNIPESSTLQHVSSFSYFYLVLRFPLPSNSFLEEYSVLRYNAVKCSKHSDFRSLLLVSCLAQSSTMKIEAICSPETSRFLRITRCYKAEVRTLRSYRSKKIISNHLIFLFILPFYIFFTPFPFLSLFLLLPFPVQLFHCLDPHSYSLQIWKYSLVACLRAKYRYCPTGGSSGVRVFHLRLGAVLLPQDSPQHASSCGSECHGECQPGL